MVNLFIRSCLFNGIHFNFLHLLKSAKPIWMPMTAWSRGRWISHDITGSIGRSPTIASVGPFPLSVPENKRFKLTASTIRFYTAIFPNTLLKPPIRNMTRRYFLTVMWSFILCTEGNGFLTISGFLIKWAGHMDSWQTYPISSISKITLNLCWRPPCIQMKTGFWTTISMSTKPWRFLFYIAWDRIFINMICTGRENSDRIWKILK